MMEVIHTHTHTLHALCTPYTRDQEEARHRRKESKEGREEPKEGREESKEVKKESK